LFVLVHEVEVPFPLFASEAYVLSFAHALAALVS
jgi:hypothetical protein